MDWSNETYVRLYTRDTTNWKRMGWDGQSVLMHVLRKVDRAGTLDLGGLDPWEAVMLHIGCTEEVARRGVEAMLKVEAVAIVGDRMVFGNFIEAQECTKSDRLRAKESRERKARGESQDVTPPSRNVTPESRDVTPPSQPVTPRHAPSRAVTPRHSLLCSALQRSALPCSATQEGERAGAPPPPPPPQAPPDPEPPELEPGEPDCDPGERLRIPALVRVEFERACFEATGNQPVLDARGIGHCATIARWLDTNHGADPRAALKRLLAGFFANGKAAEKSFPIAFLATNPPEYFAPPRRTSGFMAPAPASAFTGPMQTGDEIFGPLIDPPPKTAGVRRA